MSKSKRIRERKNLTQISTAQSLSTVTKSHIIATYQGPIPPPEVFVRYEQACPGSGDKIIELAISAEKHLYEYNSSNQKYEYTYLIVKQVIGALVVLIALLAVCFCAYYDQKTVACTIAGLLCALITIFILGKHQEEKK